MGAQLKTRRVSVAYADKLAVSMLKDQRMTAVLTTLTSIYSSLGMQNKAEEIVNALPLQRILIAMERW